MLQGLLRVYGRQGHPKQLALIIARSVPGGQVARVRGGYSVTVGASNRVFRREPPELDVQIVTSGFEGEDGEARRAVRHDLARTVRGPGLPRVLAMIPDLKIGISFRPRDARHLRHNDPLSTLAIDVAGRVDGFVLDLHEGRLVSSTGETLASSELFQAEGGSPVDPSTSRIHGRLVALLAVAARALTEYDGRDLEEARQGIASWVQSVGMVGELEPHEQAFLDRPPGALDDDDLCYGSWQVEGAAVLAWALELIDELPAYDQAMDPTVLSGVLCFPDAASTQAVLRQTRRRFHATVEAEAQRHGALYRHVRVMAAGSKVGAVDVDVALGIVTERLRACRWLMTGGSYSSTGL